VCSSDLGQIGDARDDATDTGEATDTGATGDKTMDASQPPAQDASTGEASTGSIDVTALTAAELDRRHPELVQLRRMETASDYRDMWGTIERLWSDTVAQVQHLPAPALHERVGDDWSFVETMRHLIFITDSWASRTIRDEPMPYDPLGLPETAYLSADAASLGIDLAARPTFAEVMTVRTGRMAVVRHIVEGLTETELERICTRSPAPGYPEEPRTVGDCLAVVMTEETEHHRFAVRDLAVLKATRDDLA
jgi:hypothetical protein